MEVQDTIITVLEVAADDITIQQDQAGTTLSADVTATAHYESSVEWTIDKTVTPDTWNLFVGDTGTSQYTISVTKGEPGEPQAFIDGQVCVTNGGAVATENLTITLDIQIQPNTPVLTGVPVDVSSNPVLGPGVSDCYSYSVPIPSGSIDPGATYKVTANVTITNHSGHTDPPEPFGPSPSATAILPENPVIVNDTIHVVDTNGQSFEFSASGQETYTRTFTCDEEGDNTNTATITETGQSDSATVTVTCYELNVSKTANTALTRTYNWTIDKTADPTNLTLAIGETGNVNYTVTVDSESVDSGWSVSGTITVENPAPIDAVINSITDIVSPDIAATVDCPDIPSFPHTLAAGSTIMCTYNAELPDGTNRTNTATVTLQNFDYNFDGTATPSGTTDFTGEAAVDFGNAVITEVNRCVNVVDSLEGPLGMVCADETPKTFEYSRQVGPFDTCGQHQITNTATITETGQSDSATVNVDVPCVRGLLIETVF